MTLGARDFSGARSSTMARDRHRTCDIWDLARENGVIEGFLQLAAASRLVDLLADTAGSLHFRLTGMTDERGRPAAALDLDGAVRMACDRCGAPVPIAISEHVRFFFVHDEEELNRLPIDDAPDEPLIGSNRFDVAALVEDQAILALPISPRHEDCSAPAREPAPVTPDEETHRPFEALAGLKTRRH